MDHPHPVTWTLQIPSLPARKSKTLHSAVNTTQHCLTLWDDFLTRATPHAVGITITVTDDTDTTPAVTARLDAARGHLELVVTLSALEENANQIATRLLDAVVPALVTIAEHHPQPEPIIVWQHEDVNDPPPGDEHDLATALELLDEENQLLLISRLDGTPTEELDPHRRVDDYIDERLECRGIAGRADGGVAGSTGYWLLEIFPGSAG
ncbi:hypothetical protein [Couchioplanes azureus]|uniref:hypothetical protein n=1 Tax=Couchioplanes caeruleus TaxID=56438 RepID=UPI0016714D7E|nr:hypothetical protein [Couchioplanes caeruleus]GGQ83767.1 hypothetical protein GCM10010166_62440 [Couchioplanes caeruleus subsp. azureus]